MSFQFKPASTEELAARGVLAADEPVVEAAPAEAPAVAEAEPAVAAKAPARKASKKAA